MKQLIKTYMPWSIMWYKYFKASVKIRYYKRINPERYPEVLKIWYKKKTGYVLDLNHPITYMEKIQWLKLYDCTPTKTELADKYKVREWITKRIGGEYLIPLLGVWEHVDEINFDHLPNRFVLKTNHGSGTTIVVKDKGKLKVALVKRQLSNWMKLNFAYLTGYELHYANIKPLIIAEEYLENINGNLNDYKFLCFDGEPKYCWLDTDRFSNHQRSIYNLNWELQPWNQKYNYDNSTKPVPKPENFEKMQELARILSEGFIHVRVDFYNVAGKIYFGEMTFTNSSGLEPINPYEYAKMLGDLIKLKSDTSDDTTI